MKLNNRGWGLGFLIVVGAIFLLILIFVSIRIRVMTHQMDEKKDSNKTQEKSSNDSVNRGLYTVLEQTLKKSGETFTIYHTTLIDNIDDHLIVWVSTLKQEGLIDTLDDPEGEGECNGYVFIKNDGSVQSFIKCSKYETLNYTLWAD